MRPRHIADEAHVDDVHRRVGRRFEEEDLGIGPDRCFPRAIVPAVDRRRADPPARQQIVGQPAARSKGGARRDDMVALIELAQQGRRHRRHAGRLRAARLSPLHQRDPLLQHLDRRVLQPRIGHTGLVAGKARGDRGGIVISVAGGEEQRLAGLAMLAAPRAAAHRLRRWPPFRCNGAVHSGIALHALASSLTCHGRASGVRPLNISAACA